MRPDGVRIVFLRDLPAAERDHVEQGLRPLELGAGQESFSRPARHVLDSGRDDPSRDTFAVMAQDDGAERPAGIGVLQPHPPSVSAADCGTVLFRGFSVDPARQGTGIGTAATRLAIRAAAERFPNATLLRLTVHVDNVRGRHVYERCGFTATGEVVEGRAGREHVMTCPLGDDRR